MSATVHYLNQKVKGKIKTFPDTPGYICLRCQSEAFRLYEDRTIHCDGCGSLIRNIEAVKK